MGARALRETGPIADDTELRAAWTAAVGHDGPALAAFDEVLGRHREPHRRYHGVHHVTWVVRHVLDLARAVPVTDLGAVTAAAFYHDAVYDPRADDNEAQSASLARRVLLEVGWSPERADAVADLVLATRHLDGEAVGEPVGEALGEAGGDGRRHVDGADRAVLLDADLGVLGSEPAGYAAYARGVRAEYGHLDDATWRRGRAQVLRTLLAMRPLYRTAPACERWESRARANLASELATLGVPVEPAS